MLSLYPAGAHAQSSSADISPCATEVIVAQGDTLSSIATRTLGAPGRYPAIVEATNVAATLDSRYTSIANPNSITPGWRLCAALSAEANTVPGVAPLVPQPISPEAPVSSTEPAGGAASEEEELPFGRPVVEGEPHPLSIDFLRSQTYATSTIQIKQTLTPGSNYSRYIVAYQSEGLSIDAYMTVPFGTQPATGWPVVIFNHGYIPPDVYRSAERYIAYTDAFARAGYLVFRPDYRGHGLSEGEARGAYSRPDYTIDVLNAVAAVKGYAAADADRIGMWGHSMGGYITLRSMVTNPDIKAGVIWAGVVASYPDLLEHWRGRAPSGVPRGGSWRTTLMERYGTPEENPEFWASISANSYVEELSGPVQIHHGTADASVPFLLSQLLYDEIQAVGGDVQLYSYPGDDHNISANLYTALQRSVAFFDEHVK